MSGSLYLGHSAGTASCVASIAMDAELATGYQSEPYTFSYSSKDAIIYNMAVGSHTLDQDSLRFLDEHQPLFAPLPTIGVLPGLAWLDTLVCRASHYTWLG